MEDKKRHIENCCHFIDKSQAKLLEAVVDIDDIHYDSTLASIRTRLVEAYKTINGLKQELEHNYLQ